MCDQRRELLACTCLAGPDQEPKQEEVLGQGCSPQSHQKHTQPEKHLVPRWRRGDETREVAGPGWEVPMCDMEPQRLFNRSDLHWRVTALGYCLKNRAGIQHSD